jgi:hypothetical protein
MFFEKLTTDEILRSLEAEAAKSLSELKCLRKDAEQIDARLRFILSAVHYMKNDLHGDDYK